MSDFMMPPGMKQDLERLRAMKPWASTRYTFSDVGNGYLFADFYKDSARYAADRGCWYIYNGRFWECDKSAMLVMSLCKRLTHLLTQMITCIGDDTTRERFQAHVLRWRVRRTRETLLKEAAEVYPVRMEMFDSDPMVLNCLNGTLEIRSQILRPHKAEDFLTRMANVTFNPDADYLLWDRFILSVCETNHAMHAGAYLVDKETGEIDRARFDAALEDTSAKYAYLHKTLGYALTGMTHHECMYALYGPTTRNGKSTLLETFSAMLGDYAVAAMPETLAAQAFSTSRGPSEDLARLAGARFVTLAEPDKGMRLSASLIKQLTGNDTITCRYLHENSFQYRPQFKLFLNSNHLPSVADDTVFRSGRLKVVEFDHHFTPEERDPDLKMRLMQPEVLSGVLLWALNGFRRMEEEGYGDPDCVARLTEQYQKDESAVSQFVAECLVPHEDFRLKTADVYRAYRIWCEENGFPYENSALFRRELAAFGKITKGRIGNNCATNILIGYEFITM